MITRGLGGVNLVTRGLGGGILASIVRYVMRMFSREQPMTVQSKELHIRKEG